MKIFNFKVLCIFLITTLSFGLSNCTHYESVVVDSEGELIVVTDEVNALPIGYFGFIPLVVDFTQKLHFSHRCKLPGYKPSVGRKCTEKQIALMILNQVPNETIYGICTENKKKKKKGKKTKCYRKAILF